eukprot:2605879-Rhodomonas_salina.1
MLSRGCQSMRLSPQSPSWQPPAMCVVPTVTTDVNTTFNLSISSSFAFRGSSWSASDVSMAARLASSACQMTLWVSDTQVECKPQASVLGSTTIAKLTAGILVGTASASFSFNQPQIFLVAPSIVTFETSTAQIFGVNFGGPSCSQSARLGDTACEATVWVSETSVDCTVPRITRGGHLSISLSIVGSDVHATSDLPFLCDPGLYMSAGRCVSCPTGSESGAGGMRLQDCQCIAGFSGQNGTTCAPCNAGTYKSFVGSGECTRCSRGAYLNVVGRSACFTCPGNNSDSHLGTVEVEGCYCIAGYTGPNGGHCGACAVGTYKAGNGSTPCMQCAAGTWLNLTGGTSCRACPTHSISAAGAPSISFCLCNAGYTSSENNPCIECAPGTFKEVTGPVACTKCGAGFYSGIKAAALKELCIACPGSSQSMEGSTAVTDCSCAPGFFGSNPAACRRCSAGTYKKVAGPGTCTLCRAGFFSEKVGAALESECLPCPGNASSPEGSQHVDECACGPGDYVADNGVCTACEEGFWCAWGSRYRCPRSRPDSASGSISILDCKCSKGYFLIDDIYQLCQICPVSHWCPGNNEIHDCGANTRSLYGSTMASDCECLQGYAGPVGGPCEEFVSGFLNEAVGDGTMNSFLSGLGIEGTLNVLVPAFLQGETATGYSVNLPDPPTVSQDPEHVSTTLELA